MMRMLRKSAQARDGTASVELAVLLPFLAVLALGTIDFGRFGTASISVNNAARSGALYGSTSATTSVDQAGIRNAVIQDLQTLSGVTPSDVSVTTSISTDTEQYKLVTVTVSLPFKTLFGLPKSTITLTQSCQMRIRPDQARSDGL